MSTIFLHDRPDIVSLYAAAGRQTGVRPEIIEKDYWLMHCLWSLKEQGFGFELKGGTALSKGFQIIHRFSEDIDIHLHGPPDLKTGRNHDSKAHVQARGRFFNSLEKAIEIPGIVAVERDLNFDDEKMRNAGIRLIYKSEYKQLAALKPSILLEAGFDVTIPNEACTISSWAYDFARERVQVTDNRAQAILCYWPEYTFVEKLQAVSSKFRQEQEGRAFPVNFLRHYYDLYHLLGLKRVQAFIGTEEYLAHKARRFRPQDEKDITKNQAFSLPDPATRARYTNEYGRRIAAICYREPPDFQAILDRLAEFAAKL